MNCIITNQGDDIMDNNLKNICLKLRELNQNITNLRLQKLLYFIQAVYLVNFEEPAFNSKIEAWPYGPVVPEAYFYFKNNNFNNMEPIILDVNRFTIVEEIHQAFSHWSDYSLVNLTHTYDPWITIWNSYGDKEITIEYISNYHNHKNNVDGAIL